MLILMSMVSSTNGNTYTDTKLVCRLALESKGEIRTSRCTPFSPFKKPNAKSPSTSMVTVLIPATSPSCSTNSLVLNPCFSAYIRYIRISILAQSQLSVPPAPAVIWRTALSLSSSPLSMFLNSSSSIQSSQAVYACWTSCSSNSPSLKNSRLKSASPKSVLACSKPSTQNFTWRSALSVTSAFFGSFQNSGEAVFSSSLMM